MAKPKEATIDPYHKRGTWGELEVWTNTDDQYLKLVKDGQEVGFFGIVQVWYIFKSNDLPRNIFNRGCIYFIPGPNGKVYEAQFYE